MSTTACCDCKHYCEGDDSVTGFCNLQLPEWISAILTTDQWSASRTVRANYACDLGEKQ
jgi:hypothetical protein